MNRFPTRTRKPNHTRNPKLQFDYDYDQDDDYGFPFSNLNSTFQSSLRYTLAG